MMRLEVWLKMPIKIHPRFEFVVQEALPDVHQAQSASSTEVRLKSQKGIKH